MKWPSFAGPAAAAFVAGMAIAGVALAAEPDVPRSIAPAPVSDKAVKVEPQPTVVPDDSGIPGVVAWDTRGWPGNREYFEGALPRDHYDGPIRYAVTPPAGGDHYPRWVNCGVYDQPIPSEKAVHAHEHGAVWITYQPDLPHADVAKLEDFVRRQPLVVVTIGGVRRETNERYILMSPFPGLPSPIVISSWAHQLRLDSPDDPRLQRYVDTFRMNPKYSPEYGPTCEGQPEKLSGRPIFK
ncbi:MAG: DUF3105 domain-containing protein [Acidimicrobiia bacterium]